MLVSPVMDKKPLKTNIQSVRTELEKMYQSAILPELSPLDFLRAVYDYMSYVETETVPKKIIKAMFEDVARENIKQAQDYALSRHAPEYYHVMAEYDTSEGLPIHEYDQLMDAFEQFDKVKHILDIEEIRKAKIVVTEPSPFGELTRKADGWGLINMAIYAYPKHIEPMHKYFLKQLDEIETCGVFSKLLDHNQETSVLYFNDKEILMNIKKIPTNAHYLLSYLFANRPFEQHYCDELNDDRALLESKHWKSYYDACFDIQMKVEKVTGVTDFLDFNSGAGMYVRINPKYSLSNVPQ